MGFQWTGGHRVFRRWQKHGRFHAPLGHRTEIIEDVSGKNKIEVTPLGRRIFADGGLDPYMENPATSWLLHWHLCGRDTKTTWYWAFHHCPTNDFGRESLVEGVEKLAADRVWSRASTATIRRDVSCFLRTYVALHPPDRTAMKTALSLH